MKEEGGRVRRKQRRRLQVRHYRKLFAYKSIERGLLVRKDGLGVWKWDRGYLY